MKRCEWCLEECVSLIPVVNRNPQVSAEYELICSVCVEVERFEHIDELLWSPVTFQSLVEGYSRVLIAA